MVTNLIFRKILNTLNNIFTFIDVKFKLKYLWLFIINKKEYVGWIIPQGEKNKNWVKNLNLVWYKR